MKKKNVKHIKKYCLSRIVAVVKKRKGKLEGEGRKKKNADWLLGSKLFRNIKLLKILSPPSSL
jgi:hypothetical protein